MSKIANRAQILESLLTRASCEYSPAVRNQKKGLKWPMDCPAPNATSPTRTRPARACSSMMMPLLAGHADMRDAKGSAGDELEPWLEEVTGEKIIFKDGPVMNGNMIGSGQYVVSDPKSPASENPASEPASETSESDNPTGLIFDTAEDVEIARQLGYAAELATANVTDLINKYAHVPSCGTSPPMERCSRRYPALSSRNYRPT